MAQDSWPSPAHNARAVTDVEYEKIAMRFSDNGVYGNPTDTQVVTAGIGLSVDIRAEVYASVRGHAWYSGTSTVNLAVAANASGQTRVDRVVLRLDRSDWTVRAVVKQGTPGEGPPVLTTGEGFTTYEVLLANVTILSGAGTVTVTRGERYVGTRIRPATSTALTNPNPDLGEVRWETDTKRLRLYDGDSLRTIYSDSGPIVINSPLSAWKYTVDSVLEVRNGAAHLRLGSFQRAAGTLAGTSESRLPVLIPSAYRHPNRDQYAICYTTGIEVSRAIIFSANTDRPGQVWLTNHPTISTGDFVLPGSGISWVVD
ncbi:hypothetical protein [Streptomyces sp. NPDC057877]|uniref:hypothetical protein n=1 Tax=Streptomyces sp. NPDC057877 TaxID=3346269 RepID=UPI00367D99A5